ncbi:MAG: efflux RND transporter periplasmic adaptor subunit [Bacteroidales bacterium]|nr:efflux RND transporter periplasmic adaptor subunit [Bacteroidales bacterium]
MKRNIIFLAIIVFTISCKEQKSKIKQAEIKIPVTVTKSFEKEFSSSLDFAGTAFANKEANLGTAIPGRIEKVHFAEGERVNKGELLVELSSELYAQALIERNTLQKDFERVSRLREKGSLSEQDFDHVKARYEASVAKTEMMKKNSEIRAPFSGTVVDYIVNEGENYLFAPSLKPGYSMTSGIVKLMQLNILNVEIDVNEKDLSKIHKGQKAGLIFDAYPEKVYEGSIVKIDPILSTISRTAKASIQIKNSDYLIKPGMYAKVSIELPIQKAVFIPAEAIYRQPGTGNDFVFCITDSIAKKIPVKRIYTIDNNIAVQGIESGVTITVAGKTKLNDGTQVIVKNK